MLDLPSSPQVQGSIILMLLLGGSLRQGNGRHDLPRFHPQRVKRPFSPIKDSQSSQLLGTKAGGKQGIPAPWL